jgi:hypothetical protein
MDPTADEVSRTRRRAATVHPVEQKQIETNDCAFGTPMGASTTWPSSCSLLRL